MRKEITELLGDPVPPAMQSLAYAINDLLTRVDVSDPRVQKLTDQVAELSSSLTAATKEIADLKFSKPRNVGSHFYPGCEDPQTFSTSDCRYCGCWMGGSRSGGPKGVDPFGDCPGNPTKAAALTEFQQGLRSLLGEEDSVYKAFVKVVEGFSDGTD